MCVWCVYHSVPSHPHTVTGLQRETEAIKMMSIRAGLLDVSQSWATLGRKCNVLAESQRVRGEREGGERESEREGEKRERRKWEGGRGRENAVLGHTGEKVQLVSRVTEGEGGRGRGGRKEEREGEKRERRKWEGGEGEKEVGGGERERKCSPGPHWGESATC